MGRWLFLGLTAIVCALAACSSSSGAGAGGSGAQDGGSNDAAVVLAPATDIDSFIAQYCALTNPCCDRAGLATDMVACKKTVKGLWDARPGAPYDAVAGDRCLARVSAWSQRPLFCAHVFDNYGPSCARVFQRKAGTAKIGETCDVDTSCASSADGEVACVSTSFADAGTPGRICQLQIAGKAGDGPCEASVDGLVYIQRSSEPTVHVCSQTDGLRCDRSTSKCAEPVPLGGACTFSDLDCAAGATCDSSTRTCVPQRAPGESCAAGEEGSCKTGTFCGSPSVQTQSVCAQPGADGSKCIVGAQCTSEYCDAADGTCKSQSQVPLRVSLCGT